MKFLSSVIDIFIIFNACGQISFVSAMLAQFEPSRQRFIIIREVSIALFILLIFTFIGSDILNMMGVTIPVISIVGGLLVSLIAFNMIFPKNNSIVQSQFTNEPFIVPLATPSFAGPGSMSTVMLFTSKYGPVFTSGAVLAAIVPSLLILLAAPYLKKVFGARGMQAVEKITGMLICCVGVQMIANGITSIIKIQLNLR